MTDLYVYDEPVAGTEGFHNRASELTRISSRIAADRPQSVSIVGGPRMGKTSMVNQLCDPAAQTQFLDDPAQYVCLRLALRDQPADNPERFFVRLSAALEAGGLDGVEPNYHGFNERVRQLMQQGRKLVLFFDDFGLVTQNRGFPVEFFSFMRSVANNNDVGYVTTSSAPLQKLCHTQAVEESPFFNIFTTVNLEAFKEEAARMLVEGPAQEAGAPFDEEAEWILELAGGSPYLLQLTASVAFEARAAGGLAKEALSECAFRESRGFLEALWGDLSGQERDVLRASCAGKAVDRRQEYAAESLERRGLLRRESDRFGFRLGLLERYVRENRNGGLWRRLFR